LVRFEGQLGRAVGLGVKVSVNSVGVELGEMVSMDVGVGETVKLMVGEAVGVVVLVAEGDGLDEYVAVLVKVGLKVAV
jgi:hypothetical protein